jgi:hypothetical protein
MPEPMATAASSSKKPHVSNAEQRRGIFTPQP